MAPIKPLCANLADGGGQNFHIILWLRGFLPLPQSTEIWMRWQTVRLISGGTLRKYLCVHPSHPNTGENPHNVYHVLLKCEQESHGEQSLTHSIYVCFTVFLKTHFLYIALSL